jgi:hypothetical protein
LKVNLDILESIEPPKLSVEREVQVPTNVASTFMQEEHTIELKQQGEISKPCVVDLIQPVEESDMLLTSEKEDFPLLDEEKVQLES